MIIDSVRTCLANHDTRGKEPLYAFLYAPKIQAQENIWDSMYVGKWEITSVIHLVFTHFSPKGGSIFQIDLMSDIYILE